MTVLTIIMTVVTTMMTLQWQQSEVVLQYSALLHVILEESNDTISAFLRDVPKKIHQRSMDLAYRLTPIKLCIGL